MLLNLKPFWLSNGLLDTDNHQKMIILACVTFYCLCIILLLVCIHNLLFIIVVVIVIIFFFAECSFENKLSGEDRCLLYEFCQNRGFIYTLSW